MPKKKEAGPGTPSSAYLQMAPTWKKIRTVLAGTEAMRAAGEGMLPMHPGEDKNRWSERLSYATLWNQSKLTLNNWASRPFKDKVTLSDDALPEIRDNSDNIDMQGTPITVLAQRWFREGLAMGLAHAMVDFPRVNKVGRSREDDRRERLRPYWTIIYPEQVIAARAEFIDGKEVLTHLRVFVTDIEKDETGFGEIEVPRVRMYERPEAGGNIKVTVFVKIDPKKEDDDPEAWVPDGEPFEMDIDTIPLVTFYADRTGLMMAKPPIEDLVDLNIRHYQSNSDQENCLTVARFPLLAGSGVEEADDADGAPIAGDMPGGRDLIDRAGRVIGPHHVLFSANPQAKYYYVEHTGAALDAGSSSLKDLEDKMAGYGTEYLKKKPDRMTARARSIDSKEAMSPLQEMAIEFQAALNQAMALSARWMGKDSGGVAEIKTDFDLSDGGEKDLSALDAARLRGEISRQAYLYELKRRGVLHEDYDADADADLLDKEAAQFPTGAANTDIDEDEDEDIDDKAGGGRTKETDA